jgi:hypothetical protein
MTGIAIAIAIATPMTTRKMLLPSSLDIPNIGMK